MEEQKTEESIISLIEKYNEDIKKYVTVDEFNMKQIQMDLPATRHYWVGRLMYHKQEILKLKKLRKEAVKKVSDRIQSESPVGMSDRSLNEAASNHPILSKIDGQIAEHELIVEYLSKIEANFRSLSFDIKNLISIVQLETT